MVVLLTKTAHQTARRSASYQWKGIEDSVQEATKMSVIIYVRSKANDNVDDNVNLKMPGKVTSRKQELD